MIVMSGTHLRAVQDLYVKYALSMLVLVPKDLGRVYSAHIDQRSKHGL